MKKYSSKNLLLIVGSTLLFLAIVTGGLYYYHNEYQAITFKLTDGSSVITSRHNLNKLSVAQKQAFLNPVNENALHPCIGNTIDDCIATPSADFWPIGGEGAKNPYLKTSVSQPSEIMGRLINDSTNTLQLETTSGRTVSVIYPLNPVTNFSANYASKDSFAIDLGDEIYVSYYGSTLKNNTISTNQIITSTLILKGNPKSGPTTKY